MKHTFRLLSGFVLAGVFFMASCQSAPDDSKKIAEEQNEQAKDTKAAEKDAQFVVDVAAANYAEIKMAQVALDNSNNQEIKDIANMLLTDHQQLLNQLKDYGMQHNVSTPDSATAEAQKDAMDLAENNKGAKFDKEWCDELLDKHEKTIAKLESASNEVVDPALKTWIADALPKIREHRDKLMECKNRMK